MYPENNWIKTLCNAFKLPESEWLPPAVAALLSYLLENPSSKIAGDVLFLQVEELMTTAQLLTILPARGEIIAEKPFIFSHHATQPLAADLSFFLREYLMSYAAHTGIYDNGWWSLEQVLLKADDKGSDDIKKIINDLWPAVPVINANKMPEALVNELPPENDSRPTFSSVLAICSKHFYIEKKSEDCASVQLESIPFATENFALNIGRRYKIFCFTADSEYNLADAANLLRVKLYAKSFADSIAAEPQLILDHSGELKNRQAAVDIYLNLAIDLLEVDYAAGDSVSLVTDDVMRGLHERQLSGYDFISGSKLVNPQLISDFGLHLKRQNKPFSSQYAGKTVYYKALTLLSLLSGKK